MLKKLSLFCLCATLVASVASGSIGKQCQNVFNPNLALAEKGLDPSRIEFRVEPTFPGRTLRIELRYDKEFVGYLTLSRVQIMGRGYYQTNDVKLYHLKNKRLGALLYLTAARLIYELADMQLVSTSIDKMSLEALRLWGSFELRGMTEKLVYRSRHDKVYALKLPEMVGATDAVWTYLLMQLDDLSILGTLRSATWK